MKSFFRFLLSHSVFIAVCAVALCYQSFLISHYPPNNYIYFFVFFATLSSYNFYWLLSKFNFGDNKKIRDFLKQNTSYLLLFGLAGIGMLYCLFPLQDHLLPIVFSVIFTLIYSLPLWPFSWAKKMRKVGFLKTTILAFTWSFVTVVLPCWPALLSAPTLYLGIFITRFLFMLFLCIIFDNRDVVVDKIHALHSLATDLPPNQVKFLSLVVFMMFFIFGGLNAFNQFGLVHLIFFILFSVLIYFVYLASIRKKRGYVFYYFIVDGLMLLFALQSILANFLQDLF